MGLFSATKPISRVLSCAAIYLRHASPHGSSHLKQHARRADVDMPIQSMLHRVGFTRPRGLPRCGELLPRLFTLTGRSRRLFSVALSLRSPSAAVSSYPCSLMLGLSSFALTAPAAAWLTRKPYYIIFFASCQHFIQTQRTSNFKIALLERVALQKPPRIF